VNFEEYLISKKIDSVALKKAEPALWQEWSDLFEQMSAASFTSQKLYLINPLRRKFLLKEIIAEKKPDTTQGTSGSTSPKPIFKPKIK
jgi:hypothetical protein